MSISIFNCWPCSKKSNQDTSPTIITNANVSPGKVEFVRTDNGPLKQTVSKIIPQDISLKDLFYACETGKVEIVKAYLGNNVGGFSQKSKSTAALKDPFPIHIATAAEQFEVVKCIVELAKIYFPHNANKYSTNQLTSNHFSPLHIASENGFNGIVKYLLKEDSSNINDKCDDSSKQPSMTALHLASRFGHTQTVTLLLECEANKADINATNSMNKTPLYLAAEYGHEAVAKLLLANGADPSIASKKNGTNDQTPLHQAALHGFTEIIKELLLNKKANVNAKDAMGNTPLHLAALEGKQDVIKLLLDNGAEVNEQNDLGNTSLHFAMQNGYSEISTLLTDAGAEILKNLQGETPEILVRKRANSTAKKEPVNVTFVKTKA